MKPLPWTVSTPCVAFEGNLLIASGSLGQVAAKAHRAIERGARGTLLIFDSENSQPVEVDFRGTEAEVLARLPLGPDENARRPGRPRLGVVPREVTLLPRHWEWLNGQPGGASVTLRKLVEQASRANADADRIRAARESTYRFISAMAGNQPGFEEAARALFASDARRFELHTEGWPVAVRDHARTLASRTGWVQS